MRLTLRTLLAYLDDILEPDDSEQIAKKIEESEFASNLVHRTRDCMRRLRLGVPALTGRGLGADPNTVAEYLDNTLAGDRVGEFEKICLESDVHLAEVASCHQVLTLVLGESAEVSAESRQRMYQLASHVDAPPVQSDPMRGAGGATAPPVMPVRRAKPEVPDYLRESRSRVWPLAAMILVAALLTFGGLALFGPASLRQRMTAWQTTEEAPAETADEPVGPVAADPIEQPAAEAAAPTAEASAEPAAAAASNPVEPSAVESAAGDATDSPPAPDMPAEAEPKAADDAPVKAPPLRFSESTPPRAGIPPLDADAAPEPATGDIPAKPTKPAEETAATEEPESFGHFSSKSDVLLRFNPTTAVWSRLPAMAPLAKGDHLMAFPLFRPTITLGSGVTIRSDGAAAFDLTGWTDKGVPIVSVEFGRLQVRSPGKDGNSVVFKLDDHEVEVTLVDADSTAALDVARALPPGQDPESGKPVPLTADIYAAAGLVRVRDGDAPNEMQAPAHKVLLGNRADRPADAEMPKWVSFESPSDVDRGAMATLEPLLVADRPLALSLGELSTHRRREVRALAIRSNAYLGNFETCIEALTDKDEKTLWPIYVEELRSAVARNPDMAAKVRSALEKKRAPDAAGLYRMLWGYSAEDLKNGADSDLVEALNHDGVDFRVLALWNLQNITGLPNYGYHPSDQAKARSTAVRTWKEKLRQGKIVPRTATAPAKAKSSTRGTDRGAS
jgi:hypothetical protein